MKGRGGRQATLFQAWGSWPAPAAEDEERELAALAEAAEAEASSSSGGFVGGAPGALWVFPGGGAVEERAYQVRAARAALLANTLLCLPTGLGKTLVAAVVMYNFHRWFPRGKVLFLAPTKPLVAQQRRACARLMGIPADHMAEMTGGTQVVDRKEIWQNKRVFFLTPQIMTNDLSRGLCPAAEVKCLVIDEAHKALGNYAYCQVVKELCRYTRQFRILALSATPGSDAKAVQQVISNLLISHIELCSEDSPDIQPYSHERQVEKCVVPLGKELAEVRNAYIKVLETFAGRLIRLRVLSQRDISAITKYQIILARDQFRKNPASHFVGMQHGVIEGDFALCISLYHGYELLLQMGMRSLYIFLCGIMDGSKGMTRAKNELGRNEDFMKLYSQLENMFAGTDVSSANGAGKRKQFIYSHPKLKKLEDVVVEHFRTWKERGDPNTSEGKPADTRVMIFSSFRDSVQEIAEMLSQHYPVVRVMTFVGHSTGKSTKGFTQKEQLEVVKRFRDGGYNTLVSTCVGEEGLDIGEVDLIVCFDAQKSPIRLVQRMGRTGRKRQGRILVILSEGREERTYNQSQSNKRSLLKAISENKGFHLYQHSPRMIPEGINPRMHRMLITPGEGEPSTSRPSSKERRGQIRLQKWLSYSTGTDAKQASPTEGWCLTAEESERWNGLYKIKAGDGIKKPVMPRSHFETLEDEKRTDSQAEEVHELSLAEWRLWQNRPLPTVLTDHSDRCYHFISVMEMIEQMRHEEGECSYELKTQPYFHWEDVDASDVQRRKSGHDAAGAQKVPLSRKTLGVASKAKHNSSSSEGFDAECVSLFKATSFKSVNRPEALSVISEGHAKEGHSPSDCFSTHILLFVEDAGCKKMSEKNKENMDVSASTSSLQRSIANHESAAAREFQPASKEGGSWNRDSVDSGYSCLAEDNSLLSSSMFYLPAPEVDLFALPVKSADEDPSWGKDILINAARLLTQSPPSLTEFFDSEEERENEAQQFGSVQKRDSSVFTDKLPPEEKLTSFKNSSMSTQNTSELIDTHKLCSFNNALETRFILEASISQINDLDWDELFEDDDEEQIGIQGENLLMANHDSEINHLGGEYQKSHKRAGRNASPDGDDFAESSHLPDRNGGKFSEFSILCHQAEVPEGQPSEEGFTISQGNPMKSLITHKDETLEASVDLDHASEAKVQHHEELYNASQELFSVNFDLGFAIQESEDETSEQVSTIRDGDSHVVVNSNSAEVSLSNGNLARKSPLTWDNECFDGTKFSTPLHVQNQNSGLAATETVIPLVSPLTPAREKLCQSSGSVQTLFSTPTGRQMMHIRVPRRTYMDSFSRNRQGNPQPVPRKVNSSTVKKVLANSIFRTEGLASRDTGKMENRNLNGCNVLSAEVGTSSESEEEIVFVRKNKKKVNILTSPNINSSCDLESPVHAVKKRRRPPIAPDLSSDESTGQVLSGMKSRNKKPVQGMKRQKRGDVALMVNAAKHFIEEEAELSEGEAMEVSSDESVGSENELSSSLIQFLNDETQDLNDSEMQAIYLKSVRSPAVGNRYKMVHKERNFVTVFSQPGSSSGHLDVLCSSSSAGLPLGDLKNQTLPLCILVDSREISSGPDVISTLKAVHRVKVQVCSLGGCDYVVSNRLAVERKCPAELLNAAHRSKAVQRVQQLKSTFDRICVIVEKERVKAGEARRALHRTKHYNSMLSAFIRAGIRVLFSSCQEETAGLLKELALLEQRKDAAILVPTEVEGHREEAFRFYLSIPCVGYPAALALCHCFGSVKEMANSSPGEMAARTQMSQQKAEEVYHYVHYAVDAQMLPDKIT
ncbi:Fanconi anemia group M protein isoform X2 [Rhineura floridana]|uniref:Fanconi anemia group M protein isoform X2 n=1 Tax=Rhineura floridana TaxID=261503 RepID=UPI002AC832A9|nr:Fanconi anemia group M protein isoform X2 [Rhineura floridana]